MLGDRARAMSSIEHAASLLPDDPYADFIKALVYLRYDDDGAALSSLEQAAEKGYSSVIIAAEPHLASLRSNSRFRAIVE